MVQKLDQGGKLADEATAAGLKVETQPASGAMPLRPACPPAWSRRRFAPPRMATGKPPAPASEWIVFRVTDVTVPPVDMASDDIKKLKDTLLRGDDR